MNRCVQEPQKIGKTGERNMSDDVMAEAMELFRAGDLKGAVENLDGKLRSNRDNAVLQHTYAESRTCSTWKNRMTLFPEPRS